MTSPNPQEGGKPPTPEQARLLRLFEGENLDCVFEPRAPSELRICEALVARGVLAFFSDGVTSGYGLTEAGRRSLTGGENGR